MCACTTIQRSSRNRTHTPVEGLHVEIEDVTRWHGVLDYAVGSGGLGAPGHGHVDAAAGDVDGLGRGEVGRAGHGLGGGACGDFVINTLSFFLLSLFTVASGHRHRFVSLGSVWKEKKPIVR